MINDNKTLNLTLILLILLSCTDVAAIIGGYLKISHFWYWLADQNREVLSFFNEDEGLFNGSVEMQRNIVFTFLSFGCAWSISSTIAGFYFKKRQYLASKWPLFAWKFACLMLIMRLVVIISTVFKFHYLLIPKILEVFEGDSEDEELSLEFFKDLYESGTIGLIPLALIASILLNILIILLALFVMLKNSDWRRLNVQKQFK